MPHPAPQEPSWTPIPGSTPLTYTRPLLGAEIIHDVAARLNDGLGDVCMGVTFKSTIPTDALELRARESIGRMRFHIPILASAIAADPSDPFSSAWMYTPSTGTADLRAWIDATLTVRHGAFRAEAFILEMNRRRAPSGAAAAQPSHFYLLLDDGADGGRGGVHALFMHGPHTLMDARPTLRCLDALLGWIAQPPRAQPLDALAWGAEWRSLPAAPLAATGGARADWDAAGVPLMQEIGGLLTHPVPTHSLHPPRADVQTPGAMLRVHERLDAAASARVVRAAKAHGFTPSHLFDAAVVLATFSTEPVSPAHAAAAHFTLDPTVISQDRYLVPPHTGLSHFIAGLAMVPIRVPYAATRPGPAAASAKERLLAVMATIKHTLGRFLANPNLPHVLPAQLALHPPRMSKDFSNPHATLTSNLGSVGMLVKSKWAADARETDVPVISVLDMEFGHRLGWQKIISHCWTMNSEIRLQIQAADVWDRDVLQSYLGEIKKQMLVILDDDDEALDPLKSPGANEVRVANSANADNGGHTVNDTQSSTDEPNPSKDIHAANHTDTDAPRTNGAAREFVTGVGPAPIPVTAALTELPYPGYHLTRTIHHDTYPAIAPRRADLAGRVVFISGASGGLGRAAALAFARAGAAGIVVAARADAGLAGLDALEAEMLGAGAEAGAGLRVLKVPMDVLDARAVGRAAAATARAFGRVDVLLNVAGYVDACVPLAGGSEPGDWWCALSTNVRGTYLVTRALLPLMRVAGADGARAHRTVLNFVSISGHFSSPLCSGYGMSKLALMRMTEMLHEELHAEGIAVLAVHPGCSPTASALKATPRALLGTLIDSAALAGDSAVWLAKTRRDWLGGRFVSCTWDVEELEAMREEIVRDDRLKVRFCA